MVFVVHSLVTGVFIRKHDSIQVGVIFNELLKRLFVGLFGYCCGNLIAVSVFHSDYSGLPDRTSPGPEFLCACLFFSLPPKYVSSTSTGPSKG